MTISSKIFITTLLLVLGLMSNLSAQDGTFKTIRDLETWTRATFEYKPTKKWGLSIAEELRLNENSSIVDQYFTQLKVEYDIHKRWTLGVAGRFIRFNDNEGKKQGYENHLRWAAFTQYNHKVDRLSFKYRLQYQTKGELGLDEPEDPTEKIRLRLSSTYNIKKWKLDPNFEAEIFRDLGDNGDFSKYRLSLGTQYSTKEFGSFELFYRYEKQLNTVLPLASNIIGIQYKYTLKNKKKDE